MKLVTHTELGRLSMLQFLHSSLKILTVAAVAAAVTALPAASGVDLHRSNTAQQPGSEQNGPKADTGQSLTRLPDGRWLLLGGRGNGGSVSGTAIVVDPSNNSRQILSQSLAVPRAGHSATVLPDGSVLVLGGINNSGQPVTSIERYRLRTEQFENLGDLGLTARTGHTATLLSDGRLLIIGGTDVSSLTRSDAEILDTKTMQVSSLPAHLAAGRTGQRARLMPSGDVLITGGKSPDGEVLSSAELFQIASGTFNPLDAASAAVLVQQDYSAIAPAVRATLPTFEGADVSVDAVLALRFSKPLEPSSLTDRTITVMGPNGPVDVAVTAAEGGLLAFVTPKQQWLPGTQYTLFVQGAEDTAGSALPFTASGFRTVALRADSPAAKTSTAKEKESAPTDLDGELWIPSKRNLTGVWRSGQAGQALRHLPYRKSVSRTLYGKTRRGELPEAPPGVTAVAGQVLRLNGAPLPNATLAIGPRTVQTDVNGEFLLTEVPSGVQTLVIDGSTGDTGARHYGRYEYRATIEPGKTNALPFVIWMTRLDSSNAVGVPSPTLAETVVANPRIPGLELHIPAGTVIRDSQGKNVTRISITAIPVDQPPFPLPGFPVPVYFTIQPGGAHLQGLTVQSAKGARLIYPNFSRSAPGARIDFWNYDPRQKGWYVYGQGSVSADGKQVIPDAGVVIYEFTGAMIALPSTAPPEGPPNEGCEGGAANSAASAGDPVDCFTGLFLHERTDIAIRDVIPIRVRRTYRPRDSISRAFGIGTNLSYDIFLIGDTNPWTYQELILPAGGRVRFNRTSSGTGWTNAVYSNTTTPGRFYGATIRWNTATGTGWVLTLKDGTTYTFADSYQSSSARCAAAIGYSDRFGNQLTFVRDANCNLTSVTSPNGRHVNFTYDTFNRITQISDDIGRTVTYQYDTQGRLTSVTDPLTETESYTYDSLHRMLTVTDKRGNVMVTNDYDANGRVSQQTYADSTIATFAYTLDASNRVTQMDYTNERGVTSRFQFHASGLPSSITSAVGTAEQRTISISRYPTTNLAQSFTDALGRVTTYQYDSKGNLTQLTRLAGTPNAVTSVYTYEPTYSRLTSATDPTGRTTTLSYDPLGNPTRVIDPNGVITDMAYNGAGQRTSVTRYADGGALTTTFSYNGGDLAGITDPLNRTLNVFSDALGRHTSIQDALGNVTQRTFDALDRLITSTNSLGETIQVTYDENGNLLSFEDPRNHAVSFAYDTRNRATSRTDALGNGETYSYDDAGNLTEVTDRKGQISARAYDSLNRMTGASFGATSANPNAFTSSIAYTWDDGDRITQAVDSISGTISRSFDGLDRLLQEQTPQGQVSYTYLTNGLRESMTVFGQPAVNYSYDAGYRLTQIAQGSALVAFGYDTGNRRSTLTLPNGVQASYTYDRASQLTGISYTKGSSSIGTVTYSYDMAGQRLSAGGTLMQMNLPAAVSGNTYDAGNRLTAWGTDTLGYDDNGALASQSSSSLSYVWDERGHLSQVLSGGSALASYQYDAFSRRITKTVGGSTTAFLHDGWQVIQELAGGIPTANLLTGLRMDEIFRRSTTTSSSDYLVNALGTVVALTDSSGAIQTSYGYEPYGVSTQSGSTTTNNLTFTAREQDVGAFYHYRNRYYDASLSRFISEDPIGLLGGSNAYTYAAGNPVSYSDPTGLFALPLPLPVLPGIPAPPPIVVAAAAGVGAGLAFNYGYETISGQSLGADIYDWTHPAASSAASAIAHASDSDRKAAEDDCFEECQRFLCGDDGSRYRLCFNTCMKRLGFDVGMGPTH
jgi:RHS repeat-associated protein